ncbi:nitroreductase family protein [Clostridium sp. CS001]|uniref:nitroreductase family protein n=1 Tax=Clostridium sp. CS001 TaxID=2880648 RepID=UPI001CF29A8D|nr:nitroreductase family protein [Clostridium sp. CS001]MCB2290152.1 nitroreductase family protein [Clostridium sp. CS001]
MENEVLKAIKNRKSTRKYKEEQISEEELQIILAAGIQAPSANNSQSWHFTAVQDKGMINFISDKSKEEMLKSDNEGMVKMGKSAVNIFYDAPTLIIVSGREEDKSSLVNCCAAIENMLIASESINLGTVWVGLSGFFFTLSDEVKKLKLPNGYKPFYAIAIGYKSNESILEPSKRNKDVINYIR